MNLICLLLAAVDLAGVFFNIRMLRTCFKDKTKNTFLQRSRMVAISQVACQATILGMDAIESWNGFDVQPRESCNVFRVLSIIMMLFEASNIIVIMIVYVDHNMRYQNQEMLSSKLKMTVAVSLGIIGSIITWWYSCGSQEILSQKVVKVMAVVHLAFVVFLASSAFRDYIDGLSESREDSMETCPLLLRAFKGDKKLISFIVLSLMANCFVLILGDMPRMSLHLKETCLLFILRFVVCFVLPLTVIDMVNSSHDEENEKQVVVI